METAGFKPHNHYIFIIIFVISANCVSSIDTLVQGEALRDWDHLVSSDGNFRLGFFSPEPSRNRYLGILCNWDQFHKFVWVANRNTPVSDSSSVLLIDHFGKLKIEYSQSRSIVLSHVKVLSKNVSATLLDSGNFVLKEMNFDGSLKRVLWQSFDYPTDTLLPGMKLGINFKTGQTRSLTSWISDEDPATGSFTFGGDPNGTNQLIVWWQGKVYWRSGIWRDGNFEFAPKLSYSKDLNFSYISNENEKYFMFSVNRNKSFHSTRYIIDWKGVILENDGVAPFCRCSFDGGHFWDPLGCADEKVPSCMKPDDRWFELKIGFIHNEGFTFNESNNLSLFDCKAKCLANCSCVAYASSNKNNKTGCEIWSRVEGFSEYYYGDSISREIYFLGSTQSKRWIWLITAAGGLVLVQILSYLLFLRLKRRNSAGETDSELEMLLKELGAPSKVFSKARAGKRVGREGNKSQELLFFSYEVIASATNDFSNANKLGEGGFGPVYKGKLEDGQEVAMKRLSKCSGQGMVEFKNEALLIAKLQHTNLVRLIGCCVHVEEKILIYEYMPNKSLDYFLFDSEKKKGLDWKKRLSIIEGVIQGLLYLHKYSRLRIIHRDLKASNILLDKEMNPKISDFGMARIVGPEERQTNTKRVVGTYGYMSPEYAMAGNFSTKSDVFSFGVLLLEIVSGRRNNSFYNDGPINLVGYAWELWREGRGLELMDSDLADSNQQANTIFRCIQVGLLCVENDPVDRPSMLDVLSMIFNGSTQLPTPKQPAFSRRNNLQEADIAGPNPECFSVNRVSITDVEAR